MIPTAELMQILRIGLDTSMRGEGVSLNTAIHRSNYVKLRSQFDFNDLVPIIEANPELMTEWLLYSEDKRTMGGFYLKDDEIGSIREGLVERNSKAPERVAKYVVLELDFWAKFQKN